MVFDVVARTSGAEGSFRAVAKEASGAAASFDRLGKAAAGITVAVAAFSVAAATKFEQSMTKINTQAGVPVGQLKGLSQALLDLAPKVGEGPDALATSLYHVESAFRTTGITAGKAIDIVKQASELAQIGGANLEDTTQAIIGTLSSKIRGVKDAQDAAAQLNQLVGTGDTTLEAVTKAIGTGILPVAQTLGLSFNDISAALATLSDNATPIDEAATRFRTTLSIIEKGSPAAQKALQGIGITSTQLGDDFRKPDGLLVALDDLKSHLDKTSLTATQKAQLILSAFGGAKSGATFLTLFDELDRLKSKYADAGTSAQAAAKFQAAWAQQQQTEAQKLKNLQASWESFEIQFGEKILPLLKDITTDLSQHPGIIKAAAGAVAVLAGAWTLSKFAGVFSLIGKLTTAIRGIGAAATVAGGEVTAANLAGGAAIAGRTGGIVALDGGAAALAGGRGALATRNATAYKALFAGTDAELAGGAAAAGGAGLLGGVGVGTAVAGGALVGGAVVGGSTLLAKYLQRNNNKPGERAKFDDFLGKWAPGLTKIPQFADSSNKDRLAAYADQIGGLDKKLKNFYGDAQDNKAINSFQTALKNSTIDLQSSSKSLDLHSAKNATDKASILSNQAALGVLGEKAVLAAKAYEHGTGVQSDYTAALKLSIPQILDQAQKTGISRQAAADYLNQIIQIPGYHVTTLGLVKDAAQKAIDDYLVAISKIPRFVTTYINAVATGTAQSVAGGTQGTLAGLYGAGAAGQIPGRAAGGIAKGWTWVGEKGKELAYFGSDARIVSHQDSMAAVGGPAMQVNNPTVNIHNNVDAREVAQQVGASVRTAVRARRL
jgi:TP901 family phage tail tape measure protein